MRESNHGVEGVVKILEETRKLENLLRKIEKTGVFIGSENEIEELRNFSLFVSPYFKGKEIVGHVALITDKFVEYERIYSLIEFTANRLTEYLTVTSRR
jgi:heat-inducible transcriptional repressor